MLRSTDNDSDILAPERTETSDPANTEPVIESLEEQISDTELHPDKIAVPDAERYSVNVSLPTLKISPTRHAPETESEAHSRIKQVPLEDMTPSTQISAWQLICDMKARSANKARETRRSDPIAHCLAIDRESFKIAH
jgi:hypothetical protein